MKSFCRNFLFFIMIITTGAVNGQHTGILNPYFVYPDTVAKPLKAAALSLFPDALIYSINRATKKDFAFINGQTITSNFIFTALWDNYMFGQNI